MSAIYGWLSDGKNAINGAIDRQHLASRCLSENNPAHAVYYQQPLAELGGYSLNKSPALYQSENLLAIMLGTPQWQDSGLAALAKQHDAAYVLAEGFRQQGRAVLANIGGDFACAILEPQRNYALLAVDKVGIQALAYYFQDGLLVFGSQMDQITAHPGVSTAIDPQGIFNYLYFHVVPSPESIYQGISKLQPAEFIEISQGQLSRGFYWQRSYNDSPLSKKQLLEQLHQQLQQAALQCPHDQKTGAFLSGGLDSSTVVGLFKQIAQRPIDAFSIGFAADGYDEMHYARITAKHFDVKLHEYYVTPSDVLAAIPLIAKSYDEPFGNASAIPAYYCAKFARELGMTHLLAGDGGDEIFAGNARYAKQKMFNCYNYVPEIAKALLEPMAANVPLLRKLKSYIDQAKIPMPERLETYNFLHRTPLSEIFPASFLGQIDTDLPLQNLQQVYQRGPANDLIKNMLFLDNKFTLADNDLRKVNRMCELAGVQVSYPMLQDNLLDFAASVPSNWLMQGFDLRSFYRQAMPGFLAKETLAKSKQGFGLPFGVWLASDKDLKAFAEANLQNFAKRGFVNPRYIDKLILSHQQEHAHFYGVMIWIIIMLEQWLSTHSY